MGTTAVHIDHASAESFRRDGWVLLRGALTPGDVARVATLLEQHRHGHVAGDTPSGAQEGAAADRGKDGGKDGYGDPNSDVSRDYFLKVPAVADWHRQVGLHQIAGALLGAESTVVVRDRMFVKAPGVGERTMWHQDGPFTQEAAGELVVLWIPLAIDGEAGAPLQMANGSHNGPAMLESGLAWWNDIIGNDSTIIEEGDVERLYPVRTAVASVGDIVALHGHVLHASLPNRSTTERVAYSVRLTPTPA
jgi:ectoine hydroxylase-related dioxygenase (phytanoyl-CoA dioxygenase family)